MERPEDVLERLSAVYEMSRSMAVSADVQQICDTVLEVAQKALLFNNCALLLLDNTGGELYVEAERGYSKEVRTLRLRVDSEESITATAAREARAIYVPDVSLDSRYVPGVPEGRSEYAVPLQVSGRILGVLDVESTEIDAFSEDDQKLLSCLASQTAVAIEHARSIQEVSRDRDELNALYDIAMSTISTLRLHEVCAVAFQKLGQLLDVTTFFVALYDEKNEEVSFEYFVDEGELQEKMTCRVYTEAGLTGWIIRNGKPLLINDWDAERSQFPAHPIIIGKRKPPKSWLGVPLSNEDRLIGVLSVQSYQPHAFDLQDQKVLSIAGNQIAMVIGNAILHERLREDIEYLRSSKVEDRSRFGNIVGGSPEMKKVYAFIDEAAPSSAGILIEGESGTGKELVARTIHSSSPRKKEKFVPVDCGAIQDTLFESELFGHRRGAFTGAIQDREGRFETADGGTLFLDEIGNLSPSAQAKLLRALQEGEITPVGENTPRKVNVRVIAASNTDLSQEVDKGRFRKDLFWRLNVLYVHLPPLRDRMEDLPLLANDLLNTLSEAGRKNIIGISPRAMEILLQHDYRENNVRELRNIIQRAVAIERSKIITARSIILRTHGNKPAPTFPPFLCSLADAEKEIIERTLRHTRWNKTRACQILGISRPTLNRKLKKYGIVRESSNDT